MGVFIAGACLMILAQTFAADSVSHPLGPGGFGRAGGVTGLVGAGQLHGSTTVLNI